MKRCSSLLLCCFFACLLAQAQPPDVLTINGAYLYPLPTVVQWLGASVDVSAEYHTLTVTQGKTSVQATLGNTLALVNQRAITLESAPLQKNGIIYVPQSFLSKGLGVDLTWDADLASATLRAPRQKDPLVLTVIRSKRP
jgi:hypothetical protein